jgi:hypothetical protein
VIRPAAENLRDHAGEPGAADGEPMTALSEPTEYVEASLAEASRAHQDGAPGPPAVSRRPHAAPRPSGREKAANPAAGILAGTQAVLQSHPAGRGTLSYQDG